MNNKREEPAPTRTGPSNSFDPSAEHNLKPTGIESVFAPLEPTWTPDPGTVGHWLLSQGDGRSRWHLQRLLRRVVRQGFHREGFWWTSIVQLPLDDLDEWERVFVETAWKRALVFGSPWARPRGLVVFP